MSPNNEYKQVSVSVDLDELETQLEQQREEESPQHKEVEVRSTVFSLGKDPRVGVPYQLSVPDLYLIEILKDGVNNPYIELHWRVVRADLDAAGVVGFNVYRKRFAKSDLTQTLPLFSRANFDRVSRKTISKGKFSAEKKAITNIRRSLIPRSILNPNLDNIEKDAITKNESFLGESVWNRINSNLNEPFALSTQAQFENFINNRKDEKIAYIDYTKFLSEEKNKFLQITDKNFVELSYKDKKVGYGEVFEYYVTSITKDLKESVCSNAIEVKVEDLSYVDPPSHLTAKQINEYELQIRAALDPNDNISKVIVYRKSETDILFDRVASIENVNDCINLIDSTVIYGKSYTYRIFAENIYKTLSEPAEIEYISTVQRITPQSRSNNLKIPILTVVQDQNSDNIKIIMYSNDPLVSFYVLERRDLTIHEKNFSVPADSHYGGTGWKTNKFFVSKKRDIFGQEISQQKDLLSRRVSGNEIEFIDDTVSFDHIYQYRIYGSDLFGNMSPYALKMIRVSGKKPVRTPINIKSQILRGNPFRIRISWEDDNLAVTYSSEELLNNTAGKTNKYLYRIQRRKFGETIYETFPITANKFIIDESESLDSYEIIPQKTENSGSQEENSSNKDDSLLLTENKRPFGMPGFLQENDIYFYRIAAIAENKDESNYSKEFEVSTLPELSDPIDFSVAVYNIKIRPLICKLTWNYDDTKSPGDCYIIERKIDSPYDSFTFLGKSYFNFEFYDRDIQLGNTYIYRIKAIDALKRESGFFETRITI